MFELSQLRCFTTVAIELNFRRAAERLNMTQPPLSRQIQLLEHNLGVALFTRSTRSVALTAAGRAFFIEAQTLLERAQQAALS
ncbi:LysR family transcriptional regulator, partial [Pseudomonas syringae pv. actinidiae]|nr:LysR family transcriptional regulator [Pseudomonas syringae pv. actinidiae]